MKQKLIDFICSPQATLLYYGGIVVIGIWVLCSATPKGKETVSIKSNDPNVVYNWIVANNRNGFKVSSSVTFPIAIVYDSRYAHMQPEIVNGYVIVTMER